MPKRLKLIGMILLLFLGVSGASLYYFWREATQLPEWYVNKPANKSTNDLDKANPKVIAKQVEQKIKAQTERGKQNGKPANVEVNLTSAELSQLVAAKLTEKTEKAHLSQAIKGMDTKIANDRLKTGAVVDLSTIKPNDIGDRGKTLLNEVTQKFPALANREVYIGIEGKPQIDQGHLKFDASTRVQVGQLSFTVTELADRLGIPEATLLEKINLNLDLNGLKVDAIELKGDNAVLKGAIP
jgi:hypothetical protein